MGCPWRALTPALSSNKAYRLEEILKLNASARFHASRSSLILRSRALARRLEGWPRLSWFETAQERLLTMRNTIIPGV
jgi:hypothetical protein